MKMVRAAVVAAMALIADAQSRYGARPGFGARPAYTGVPAYTPGVPSFIRGAPLATPLDAPDCDFVTYAELTAALKEVQSEGNGGFGFHMWATVMNRNGHVCHVTHSGDDHGDQWPGSRVISAQKANTANSFCLPGFALSTANLYQPVQPGGSLYGLQHSNPVDTAAAYGGDSNFYGSAADPMVGKKVGGVNVFGGGLGLYNSDGELVGAIGVSGDSSCADHVIAWKVRHALDLDYVPAGPNGGTDNIITPETAGFGHPSCLDDAPSIKIAEGFADTHPVSSA